jgi:ATP-dependent Lon protease
VNEVTTQAEGLKAGPDVAQPLPLPADAIIIVPVRNFVMFPEVVLPMTVGRPGSIAAAQAAVRDERPIGVLTQRDPDVADPAPTDLYKVGTIAKILRYVTAPDGVHNLIVQGEQRFHIVEFLEGWPFLVARVRRLDEPETHGAEIEARLLHLRQQALETLQLLPQAPSELTSTVQTISSAAALADMVAAYLDLAPEQKQEILETTELQDRLDKISRLLAQRLEVLRLSQEIGRDVQATLGGRQREALLREQMAAIQRQLGEGDGRTAEIGELSEAIAKALMPAEVEQQARKELRRLERMPDGAAEHGMIRAYLDWLIELPWALPDERLIDISDARRILDDDHYDLDKIKRRILEYLAVRKLAPRGKAPILCFIGPPGVGKTSLGQSIARAMGRVFVRVSLGGVHDEAEIRGHRRKSFRQSAKRVRATAS